MIYTMFEGDYVYVVCGSVRIREYVEIVEDVLAEQDKEPSKENIEEFMIEVAEELNLSNVDHLYEKIRDKDVIIDD